MRVYFGTVLLSLVVILAFGQAKKEDLVSKEAFYKKHEVSSEYFQLNLKPELVWVFPSSAHVRKENALVVYESSFKVIVGLNRKVDNISIFIFKLYVDQQLVPSSKLLEHYFRGEKLNLLEGLHTYKIECYSENNTLLASTVLLYINYLNQKPNLYLYTIGIPHGNLKYTVNDAIDFGKLFVAQKGVIYENVYKYSFTDTNTTKKGELQKAFGRLRNMKDIIKPKDVLLILLSTHGDKSITDRYILPCSDYSSDIQDITSLDYQTDVMENIKDLSCKKVVFLDACKSGLAIKGRKDGELDHIQRVIANTPPGIYLLTSSQDSEPSYEDEKWENGAFTEAILIGLGEGEADTKKAIRKEDDSFVLMPGTDGEIWVSELEEYLGRKVPELVQQVFPSVSQKPTSKIGDAQDFPIYQILRK